MGAELLGGDFHYSAPLLRPFAGTLRLLIGTFCSIAFTFLGDVNEVPEISWEFLNWGNSSPSCGFCSPTQQGSETMANTQNEASNIATDETGSLIAASKVNGTSVYNTQGESLGSIYDVMIDKLSGQVSYAVMSFGGFLGIGEDYHPLPWSMLHYDTNQGGYVVNLDKQSLEGAPRYRESEEVRWDDPEYTRGIDDYYARYGGM